MIVLDTHIWIWWISGCESELGITRSKQIQDADEVAVSAISCFEVAWLQHHNRITLSCSIDSWFEKALSSSCVKLLPLTPEIATQAVSLPDHHSDPQDRIIIATALFYGADLMSSDHKFPLYKELRGRIL